MAVTHIYWDIDPENPENNRIESFESLEIAQASMWAPVEGPNWTAPNPPIAAELTDFMIPNYATKTITFDVPRAKAEATVAVDNRWQQLGNGSRLMRRFAEYFVWMEVQDFQSITAATYNAMSGAARRDRWPRLSEVVLQLGAGSTHADVLTLTNAIEEELRANIQPSAKLDIAAQLARRAIANASTVPAVLAIRDTFLNRTDL